MALKKTYEFSIKYFVCEFMIVVKNILTNFCLARPVRSATNITNSLDSTLSILCSAVYTCYV